MPEQKGKIINFAAAAHALGRADLAQAADAGFSPIWRFEPPLLPLQPDLYADIEPEVFMHWLDQQPRQRTEPDRIADAKLKMLEPDAQDSMQFLWALNYKYPGTAGFRVFNHAITPWGVRYQSQTSFGRNYFWISPTMVGPVPAIRYLKKHANYSTELYTIYHCKQFVATYESPIIFKGIRGKFENMYEYSPNTWTSYMDYGSINPLVGTIRGHHA